MTYRDKWGYEDEEDQSSKHLTNEIINELYEKHYKKLKVDPWIIDYQHRIAKAELQKHSGTLTAEEIKASKEIFKHKLKRDSNNSKIIDLSRQNIDPSNDDHHLQSKQLNSPNRNRLILINTNRKESEVKSEFPEKDRSPLPQGAKTPTKKDIKKKKQFFEEEPFKYITKARNSNSFEDFAEFEKISPMVKQSPHERPQLQDMNKVLAERIKKRYRSTDRFIRVQR